jgi:hypothetical protein
METKKQYTVGETTRTILEAYDAFQAFKDTFLRALVATYGEDRGDELYNGFADDYEVVERDVLEFLRLQLNMNLGTGSQEVTI